MVIQKFALIIQKKANNEFAEFALISQLGVLDECLYFDTHADHFLEHSTILGK